MKHMRNYMEDILNQQISGYHQYVLNEPVHISYVSRNFCEMSAYSEKELLHETEDLYAKLVHPSDRALYLDFIRKLAEKEQTLSCEYRLIKKDGSVIYVKDTASSKYLDDGSLIGCSVLADISHIKNETNHLQFLNETIPCGFIKYSCEQQPKITYINQKMIDMLRFPQAKEGEMDYLELYKSNIYLMVPMEERQRFSQYLRRVYSAEAPIAGEITLLRCDGSRAYVFGWVSKCVNEQGVEEFQSVCMDITSRHQDRKANETHRYLKALSDVYDKIFEFDRNNNTVKCLHSGDSSSFKGLENIAMQMDTALEQWLLAAVSEDNRADVRHFFRKFCEKTLDEGEAKPPQIRYQARSSDGSLRQYRAVFIKMDESISFYCCREIKDSPDAMNLKDENDRLKENMRDLVMRFSDGIAAFELSPESMVKPLYASENVCEFFGYSQEEWLPLTETFTPMEAFVAYSEASYEDFVQLLKNGEAEFSYFDYKTESERRIKAICSQKEAGSRSSRFVMLYSMDDKEADEKKTLPEKRTVSIRTFGYFDVFIGDRPMVFRNKKSKELFALLVDRRGGYISSEEAISFLWEDEDANPVTLARYRKVALRLKNTLEEYGIAHIIESVDGKRRLVMDKVQCDLFQYLSGREEYAQLFKGSYLSNYSWAETTLGELMRHQE